MLKHKISVNESVGRFVRFRSKAIHTSLIFSHIDDKPKPFVSPSDYLSIQSKKRSFQHKLFVNSNYHPNQSTTIIIVVIQVTAGNFLPTSKNCGEFLAYAVGAPRANGTGQVVLFVKCHSELLKVSSLSFFNFLTIVQLIISQSSKSSTLFALSSATQNCFKVSS